MSVMVGIRCSVDQKLAWQQKASSQNRSLSNWLSIVADEACADETRADLVRQANVYLASPQSGLDVRLAPNGESRIYTYAGIEKVFRFRSDLQKDSIIPPALRAEADGMWDGAK